MNRCRGLLVSLLMLFVVLLALTGGAHAASASTGIQGAVGCSTLVTFSYGGLGESLEASGGTAGAQDPQVLLWPLSPAALAAAKYGPGVGKAIYAQRDRAWKAALVSGRVLVTVGSSVVTDARMCVTGYGAGNAYGRGIACAMTAANFVPVGGTAFRGFRALAVLKGAPKGLRAIRVPQAAFETLAESATTAACLGRTVSPLGRTYAGYDTYLTDVARHYSINLRGVKAVFDYSLSPGVKGLTRASDGGLTIRIHPGFANEADLANTIAHELSHARDFQKGLVSPEAPAYASGNALEQWINGLR